MTNIITKESLTPRLGPGMHTNHTFNANALSGILHVLLPQFETRKSLSQTSQKLRPQPRPCQSSAPKCDAPHVRCAHPCDFCTRLPQPTSTTNNLNFMKSTLWLKSGMFEECTMRGIPRADLGNQRYFGRCTFERATPRQFGLRRLLFVRHGESHC
jgi:hypothetical protein